MTCKEAEKRFLYDYELGIFNINKSDSSKSMQFHFLYKLNKEESIESRVKKMRSLLYFFNYRFLNRLNNTEGKNYTYFQNDIFSLEPSILNPVLFGMIKCYEVNGIYIIVRKSSGVPFSHCNLEFIKGEVDNSGFVQYNKNLSCFNEFPDYLKEYLDGK